jgi:hypothetical protein
MNGKQWRISANSKDTNVELYSPQYAKHYREMCEKLHVPYREVPVAPESSFDEVVVDEWLHIEKMDTNQYWMRVGDACINVSIQDDGKVDVQIERNIY